MRYLHGSGPREAAPEIQSRLSPCVQRGSFRVRNRRSDKNDNFSDSIMLWWIPLLAVAAHPAPAQDAPALLSARRY